MNTMEYKLPWTATEIENKLNSIEYIGKGMQYIGEATFYLETMSHDGLTDSFYVMDNGDVYHLLESALVVQFQLREVRDADGNDVRLLTVTGKHGTYDLDTQEQGNVSDQYIFAYKIEDTPSSYIYTIHLSSEFRKTPVCKRAEQLALPIKVSFYK